MPAGLLLGLALAPASYADHAPRYLVVADAKASSVQVFDSAGRLTGRLDDVLMATHAGTVQLTDGRLLLVDDAHHKLLAVTVDAQGAPKVTGSADIPSQEEARALWLAVDPTQRFLAIGSGSEADEEAGRAVASVVDLRDYRVHQIEVPLSRDSTGTYNEAEVLLTAPPRRLVVTTGNRFSSYSVQAIMAGDTPPLLGTAPVGDFTHGPAITPDGRRVVTTTARGVDSASVSATALTASPTIPYSVDTVVGQNYRPRLAADGTTLYGSVWEADHLPGDDWATIVNDVTAIDIRAGTSRLLPLDTGLAFTARFALSTRYAAFVTQQSERDVLSLLDVRPGSATRDHVVERVLLPRLVNGPIEGVTWRGAQTRALAISPDGDRVWISAGGQGTIDEVDTKTGAVVRTLTSPTSLNAGGYLTVVQKGTKLTDLMGR